jgi:hypothetical protein
MYQLIDFNPPWSNSPISTDIDKRIMQELRLMNGFGGIQNMSTLVGYLLFVGSSFYRKLLKILTYNKFLGLFQENNISDY